MDLRRFITLKTVVEEGSFLRASQKLCCTQSTVTFHIQQLEQEFSVQLFEKIGRRMCLTREGKKLLPHIYELTRVMDTLREAAKKEVGSGRGTTRCFRRNVAFLPNAAGVAAFSATRTKSAFIVAVSELLRDP
ncbi:LysR family transcriptional regulator [Escherichia coli 576-1]|nr:LysR family transcriptional regulator [Escherichia coli 576-1]